MASRATAPARAAPRFVTDIEATWNAHGQRGIALVYNISVGGCMIESPDEPFFPGDVLALSLPQVPSIDGCVVWQDRSYAGVQFREMLDAATVGELGFKEPDANFEQLLPRDRFGRVLPILSGRLPF